MSAKTTHTPSASPAAVEPAPVPTPSPIVYADIAAPLQSAIEQFNAALPPLDNLSMTKEFITRKRRVPAPLVTHAVSAILVEPELQNMKSLNIAQMLDDKQCLDVFIPLERNMDAAHKALIMEIQAREARLAGNSQQVYAVSKALARDRDATTLGVHVVNMKRAMKVPPPRRRRNPEDETPETPGKESATPSKSSPQ
jgi:hypothetical protein